MASCPDTFTVTREARSGAYSLVMSNTMSQTCGLSQTLSLNSVYTPTLSFWYSAALSSGSWFTARVSSSFTLTRSFSASQSGGWTHHWLALAENGPYSGTVEISFEVLSPTVVYLDEVSLGGEEPPVYDPRPMEGYILNQREHPVPGATVSVSSAVFTGTLSGMSDGKGYYIFTPTVSGLYTLEVSHSGYKSPPWIAANHLTATGSSVTFTLKPRNDAVVNGDFEDGLAGWTTSCPDAFTVTRQARSGAYSLVMSNTMSQTCGLSQTLSLNSVYTPTLSFWYSAALSSGSWFTARVSSSFTLTRSFSASQSGGWTHHWLALAENGPYSGTVEISFEVLSPTVVYLDEVSLDGGERPFYPPQPIEGYVLDQWEHPVLGATVSLTSTILTGTLSYIRDEKVSDEKGYYSFTPAVSGICTLEVSHSQYKSPPWIATNYVSATASTITFTLKPMNDAVVNGDFEDGLAGWTASCPDAFTVTRQARSGAYSLVMSNAMSHTCGLSQTLSISDAHMYTPTLSFWYSAALSSGSWFTARVSSSFAPPRSFSVSQSGGWTHHWLALAENGPYSGTAEISFEVLSPTVVYLDEVSLGGGKPLFYIEIPILLNRWPEETFGAED